MFAPAACTAGADPGPGKALPPAEAEQEGAAEAHLKEGFQQHDLGQPVPVLPVEQRHTRSPGCDLGEDPTRACIFSLSLMIRFSKRLMC